MALPWSTSGSQPVTTNDKIKLKNDKKLSPPPKLHDKLSFVLNRTQSLQFVILAWHLFEANIKGA